MWRMGIRDKQLICIIKQMLKAPVVMPNGDIVQHVCGTPQGGILSPLLSNIVLNELDWWITSQWENIPTHKKYKETYDNRQHKGDKYRALRNTNLKEMYIVRYADDFKIFCRKKSDTEKVFTAVKQWLQDRLKLQISEEKSKIVNLKKHYSEFLGFKLKAVKKGNKYVIRSHMSDKSTEKVTKKLSEQIKKIQTPQNKNQSVFEILKYNQMVEGIQNYYRFATHINKDCDKIQRMISTITQNRLKGRISKKGILQNKHIEERYGHSQQLRYIDGKPFIPIGYVQTKNPMYKKKSICKYTKSGREEIHKYLKFDEYVLRIMGQMLYDYKNTDSIEYTDNRISLYCAQRGKCAILNIVLDTENINCHHKLPKSMGGKDDYKNLIIVHKNIHKLIHATNTETINKYLSIFDLKSKQKQKINSLRKMEDNQPI